ncbi:hypothetical protein FIV02_06955 [Pseudomonas sp. THAF187a]|uniref:DUF6279 family lipoprotein n=1 Tax=unclassified Pseudomonas TaxID=196821 RepID=UPI001268D98E|nr:MULTISPECIES: DUF6279 family lipoprotein [unclassified Pseudomonas]QFT21317.1 hypothetical protein FIV02_06955 [Pseudomonas sp. THAF187a]QFT41505.1 hypothetical protein FIU98_06940 [Pseudomonas sp. THAF42]
MRKSLLLLLALTVALGACSRAGLAYRNLDWIIPWKLGDYVELSREQGAWLEPRLQRHLTWHCSVELPHYLDWLQRSRQALAERDAELMLSQLDGFEQAMQRIAVEITPSTVELLRGLNPLQVERLFAELEEQNRKLRATFLEPPLDEQISLRAERMNERLQPWFGDLEPAQRERVLAWARSLGAQNQVWLDNRLAWQQALRDALEARRSDDFAARISALLQQRERFYTEAYRASYQSNREAMAGMLVDIVATADARQLQRADERLDALRADLAAQQCRSDDTLARR